MAARSRSTAAHSIAESLRREIAASAELIVVLDPGSLGVAQLLRGAPRWGLHVHWSPDLLLRPWQHLSGDRVPRLLVPLVSARMRATGHRNKRILASAPFLVALTPSHTRVLREHNSAIEEIANPVECGAITLRPAPRAGSVVTIGFVGRLSHEKGPDLLVEAYSRVRSSVGPIRLVIAGSGAEEAATRRRANTMGRNDIEFLGWVANARSVLDGIDVLVLPSRTEALGLVLVEALAAGCQVVAADAGSGVRDVLEDGRLGRIVPVDDVDALAFGIAGAVADVRAGVRPDSELIEALMQRHDPTVVLDAWLDLLRRRAKERLPPDPGSVR